MRLDVIADFREEGWPSMDLSAEMLVSAAVELPDVECRLLRPKLLRLSSEACVPRAWERASGRYLQYPALVSSLPRSGRYFHVADHSYAHLLHVLPRARSGVYCHDLDAFRAALPQLSSSAVSPARRALSRLLMSGLRRAAVVFYSTAVVRDEILRAKLVAEDRLVQAPFGVAAEFGPENTELDARVRARLPAGFVLNVGSCIPRKNVPFLLQVFAALRRDQPALRLVQIGGAFGDAERSAQLAANVPEHALVRMRGLPREELAAYYRQAQVVLLPTRAEGFGLPLMEALACGANVLASDLPVLREVGGGAALYAPASDLHAWLAGLRTGLSGGFPPRQVRLDQAARYSWYQHAQTIVNAYRELDTGRPG